MRICRTSHRGQQGESGTFIRNKSTASGQVTERRRGELRTMIEEQDNKFRSENVSARNDPQTRECHGNEDQGTTHGEENSLKPWCESNP